MADEGKEEQHEKGQGNKKEIYITLITFWSAKHISSLGFFSSLAISNSNLRCSSLRSLFNLFSSRFSCFNRSFS